MPLSWSMYFHSINIFKNTVLLLQAEARASHQFTDVNRFTLKCMVCHCHLTGQVQAQQHAKETGHTNFGEVTASS